MIYEARGERREPWEDEGAMVHLTWKQEMIGELEVVYPVVKRERFGAFGVSIFPIYSLLNGSQRATLEVSKLSHRCMSKQLRII